MKRNKLALGFALSLLLAGEAAQASEVVYLGDCTRAQMVKDQTTIDTLIADPRYEGVQRLYTGDLWKVECRAVQLSHYTLTRRSASYSEVVYDLVREDINFGAVKNCMDPAQVGGIVTGSVTFTTNLVTKGELCEVYIWSDWKQYLSTDANWNGGFGARVQTVGGGGFVVGQPRSNGGKYWTPLAFTGVVQ